MDGEYFLAAFFFSSLSLSLPGGTNSNETFLFSLDFISQFHIVFDVILNFLKDPVTVCCITQINSRRGHFVIVFDSRKKRRHNLNLCRD